MSAKRALLDDIKRKVRVTLSAWQKQRDREYEDLKAQVGEMQWTEAAKSERQGMPGGNGIPAIPPRPMLSVNLLSQPQSLVMSQARQADLGVRIHPVSESADKELAERKQDLYRRIERDSEAADAREWALDRASKAGTGVWRVVTRYDEDSDNLTDQELGIERVFYQDGAYWDPAAQARDMGDAEFAFLSSFMSVEQFKRKFPKAKLSSLDDDDFAGLLKDDPEWITADGDSYAVRIVEFFGKEYENQTMVLLEDGMAVPKDQMPPGARVAMLKDGTAVEREVERCNVMVYTAYASEIIKTEDWESPYIPLVYVVGEELQPIKRERRMSGMFREAIGAQRYHNMAVTTSLELMSKEPKSPWMATKEQVAGYESWYQAANVRDLPYLLYNAQNANGQPLPPPSRIQRDMTGMSIALASIQESKAMVQATTKVYSPSLGEVDPKKQSGRAILALQSQSDAGTSNYLSNLARAMKYEAKVILSKMGKVYDRPGRVVHVVDGQDNESAIMLNAPFVQGPNGPQRVPMQIGPDGQPVMPQGAKIYDLSKGKYGVSVTVGKSYQTRLQEGDEVLGQIIGADPASMMIFGDIWMRMRDVPGSDEIADRLKTVIEQAHPGITKGKDGAETAQELKAQNQALTQKLQEAEQMLQQAGQALETDEAKQKATIQTTEMKTQADLMKAQMDGQLKLAIEDMKARLALELEEANAENERRLAAFEASARMSLEAMKLEAQQQQQAAQQRHEAEMGAAAADTSEASAESDREFQGEQAEREREHGAEQAERDRATAQADGAGE